MFCKSFPFLFYTIISAPILKIDFFYVTKMANYKFFFLHLSTFCNLRRHTTKFVNNHSSELIKQLNYFYNRMKKRQRWDYFVFFLYYYAINDIQSYYHAILYYKAIPAHLTKYWLSNGHLFYKRFVWLQTHVEYENETINYRITINPT